MVFAFSRFMFDKEEGSFPGDSVVKKNLPTSTGDLGLIPESGRSSGEGKWQPPPAFLPGESRGQRSLAGYRQKTQS